MSLRLALSILRKPWLIESSEAERYLPILMNAIDGQGWSLPNQSEKTAERPSTVQVNRKSATGSQDVIIQVIPIIGTILKYDEDCGPVGTETITGWVQAADNNPNIHAIILKIDSGGGMVDGTQTLVQAIKNCKKPVVAFISDGMAASAAYWIASAADDVFASQASDVVGSIGVMCTIPDFKAYYESKNLKIHYIYARQSTEKNQDIEAVFKGDIEPVQDQLSLICDLFINDVKANRKGKINTQEGDPFKGAVFFAERAVKIGLIDGIKTWNQVVDFAAEKSLGTKTAQQLPINNSTQMKKFSFTAALLALASFFGMTPSSDDETIEVEASEDKLKELDQILASHPEIVSENQTLKITVASQTLLLADKDAEIAALKAEIAKLPGAAAASPVKETPEMPKGEDAPKNKAYNPDYAHNQMAEKVIGNR